MRGGFTTWATLGYGWGKLQIGNEAAEALRRAT